MIDYHISAFKIILYFQFEQPVLYICSFFSSNIHRHMLLLSIPSILLLIYQSCLVKLKPHYIFVGCLMLMVLVYVPSNESLKKASNTKWPIDFSTFTFSTFFFFLYTTFGYNNIIMVHLFSLLFMQTCPSVVVHKLWIDRFSCLVALWLMCFHGLQSRSYLLTLDCQIHFIFKINFRG